jgi:hypothetical protein
MLCKRDDGQHDVELEIARLTRDRDRRVVADDLGCDHRHGLGDHGIDLARHDAAARLQAGQRDLGEARERPAVHPA